MYRSRFRTWKKSADKSDRPHQVKTNIYTNRSNCHVIDRMLEHGKRKWLDDKTILYNQYKEELQKIESDTSSCGTDEYRRTEISRFVNEAKKQKKIDRLRKYMKEYENDQHIVEWDNMISQLYNRPDQYVGRLVIANRIMQRPTETFYMDPDKCMTCNIYFTFDNVTNINICTHCGYTTEVLFISEDNSQDVLINKDPGTGSIQVTEKPATDYQYIRSPLYKRYLNQFSENAGPIPIEIMRVLYKYLSTIHFQNSIRCRPTPVSNILRQHGFSKWANMSIRISKVFNGEPIPVLSVELIKRLVDRFEIIFEESSRQKKKLPSFEFITNILLRIEGEIELAQSFTLQKTRNVLRKIYQDLVKILDVIKINDTKYTWDVPYSF